VPAFTGLIESSKERATRDLLVSSIAIAKQQALSKRVDVYICPTTNGSSCAANWGSDWLVYEDTDRNASLDASDTIIANIASKSELIKSTTTQVYFLSTGHAIANTFTVCSNTDSTIVYQIELSRMGRVSYSTASGGC